MKRTRIKYNQPKQASWKDAVYLTAFIVIFSASITGILIPHHFDTPVAHAEDTSEFTIDSFFKKQIVSPVPSQQPTTAQDIDRWERIKHAIRNIAPYYGISPKLGIAQAALESQRGTSQYCIERNNCFGIGAFDWNPDMAYTFNSIEEGVIEYYRLERDNFPEAWAAKDDPQKMLELLESNDSGLQYATDPDYIYKITNLPEWSEN